MKTLKRIVSVTLAFLMIFSSMSILSSAELGDGNQNSFVLTTKFFREDPDTGEWIETSRAAKGEEIRARIYMETDFYAGTHLLYWLYPSNFMTFNASEYRLRSGLYYSRYSDFENFTDDDSIPNTYGWEVNVAHALEPGGLSMGTTSLTSGDYAYRTVNNGYMTEADYENKGWIGLAMDTLDEAVMITDDYYLYEISFLVNDDAEGVGTLQTPEAAILTAERKNAILNIDRHADPSNIAQLETMRMYQASWTLDQDAYVSTQSVITLDVDGTKTDYTGDISEALSTVTTVSDPAIGKVFLGWDDASTETVEKYTSAELSAMTFDYEDATYTAVFEAAEASFFVKVVEQKADGTWPTDDEIAAIEPVERETAFDNTTSAKIGDVINAKDYAPVPDGFEVYNTTDTVTVTDTDDDVLIVKLARKSVTVTFDGGSSVTGLYGSTQTAPAKTTDAGYSNEGWYTTDADGALADKIAADGGTFTMPAAATNYTSNVVADKQDLTVNVTYYDTIANQLQTVPVTLEDVTATGNKVEIVETLPETPVEGTDYILISDITKEAELEHYAFDATSASNNLAGTASATGLTLTVGYAAKSYTATFDTTVDGVADVTETVTYGGTVVASKLPTEAEMEAAKPGYSFEGWYTTVDGAEVKFVPGETIVEGDVTYTAKFTANKVKITYAYAGDDIPAGDAYALPENVEDAIINDTFSLPAITAPNGYKLEWTVTNATKNDDGTYTVGTQDITVTGTWSLESYTLTYYYWDSKTEADVMDEVTLTYKDQIPADVVAKMPGYQFVEWVYYNAETETIENHATMPAYDLYAVATFNQIKYTVQFIKYDIDELDYVEIDTVADYYQGMVLNSQVPATGLPAEYKFLGWKDADGNEVSFTYTFDFKDAEGNYVVIPEDSAWTYDEATANATLEVYADYLIPVEFDPNGGSFTVDGEAQTESMYVDTAYDAFIEKDENNWNIAREDFTFDGWDPVFENGDEILPEESTYFSALWLPNINYVFAGNVPAGVTAPVTVKGAQYDTLISVPAYTVAGYSYTVSYSDDALDNGDGTYNVGDMPVTVTYTWTADGDVAYTVETYLENSGVTATEFDAANYSIKEKVTRTGTTGETITFAEELYTGFTFEKLDPADATIGGDGLTVVKAYYSRNTVNVTVKDEDGNEILDDDDQPIVPPTAETGDEIDEPTYQPDTDEPGKEFDKWVDEEGNEVEWPLPVDGEEDIVIIPTYKYTDYSVTYVTDASGEAAPAGYELPQTAEGSAYVNTAVAHYGDAVAVPAWNDDTVAGYNVTITVTGANEADGAYTVGEGNVVVTAKWSKDIFTVDYVTVGTAPAGYELPADVASATIGTKVEVPAWTAPAGYELKLEVVGAEKQNDGTYEVYNSNVTVTATWTKLEGIAYTVETYLENLNVTDYANLDNYTLKDTLTRTGTTGDAINFTEDLYEGFTYYKQVEADATIGGDGKTVVKVYYTRDTVKVTVKDEDGNEITDENGDPIFEDEYDYGDEITEPTEDKEPAPTEPGTEFDKWVDEEGNEVEWPLPVDGEEDIVIVPTYKYIDYSVTYVTDADGIAAPAGYELPAAAYANTTTAHYGDAVAVPAWNNDTVAGYNVTITVTGANEADGAYTVGEGNVVVTAKWSYDEYALTYSYDTTAPAGAVVPTGESLYVGKVVTLATPADVAGYTFTGWVIGDATYDAGATYTATAANVEAVGSWTANDGVTYFIRRHFEVLGQDGVYGAEENLITKTGKAGDAISYSEKVEGFDFYKQEPADATIGGDGKTVVDVYYNRKTVTVTVYNEDDTVNDELSGEYEYGSTITEPKDDPESSDEGKSFDEWVYEDGTPVTWPIEIDSEDPIVIKPSFYNNTYTVRFLISADKVYTEDTDAEYSTTIVKPEDPDPAKVGMTGYTFVEWRRGSVDGAAWTAADTVPAGNIDYYAYFTANSNITYKINKYFQNVELTDWDYSLTKVETVTDATAGAEVTLDLEALAVEGFTIDETNSVIKQVINGNGKTEFVVYYLRNKTTVNIDGVDEEVIFGDELTEEEVEEIIKDNGTYDEGYEYTGWTDENGDPVTFPYTIPASGGKLTPVYTLKSFTLTFVDEDGNELQSGEVEYKSALADVTPAYPTKEGYTPTGWFDVADGTTIPATMPAKDVTYKVAYTNATNTAYTITIYVMDLEGNYTIKTSTIAYGTTGDTAMIVPEEHIGLYEDTTHADRNLSGIIAADGSTELRIYYAREKYTVTYDGTPVEAYYGSAVPAPAADPVAPAKGKEFAGWFDADGNEPSDYAAMPANNLVFTSSWTDAEYTVTYVVNGTVTTETYKYGETIATPETPNVPGMNFTGWVCDGVAGIPATMPDYDIVVVAQFGTAYYTVTFLDDVNGAEFDKITVLYGAAITLPAETPTKEHYTFIKWSNVPETMPAEDIVIVPEFERVPVKLVPKTGSTTKIDYEEKIIYGLKTNLSDTVLREQFLAVEGDGYIVINTYNGQYGFYGTGATVDLYDNVTGELLETYTIVVFGDINGDSRINSTDSSMVSSEVNRTDINTLWSYEALATYNKYKTMAADINMDGKVNATDKGTITNATLGSVRIDQVTREVIRAEA